MRWQKYKKIKGELKMTTNKRFKIIDRIDNEMRDIYLERIKTI